ncbi:ATP-binding protein [Halopseudomonas salegens]|uniref:histidine kinase n=1 Tax=Halopseudomonas salegens TaxID=1434072 RepID=A0A1H2HM45_9GAMM|nr:ATP-binding protein [Halopseudomonas salegens]SDU32872.1 PAS domain S-box-containing protein [Halopseudomonas salegens]
MNKLRAKSRASSRLIMLLGGLSLALFFAFLTAWGWQQREAQWAQYLNTQAEVQRLAVLQAQYGLEQQALLLAEQLAADSTTQEWVRTLAELIDRFGQQDPRVLEQRQELQRHLRSHWLYLRNNGANQLHIHLAPGVVSLLRMHQPEKWGDRLDHIRPLIDQVQKQGHARHGMEIGRFGSGIRGVVPIFSQPNNQGTVVGSLEVGFGMLPELRQLDRELDAGLALLLYAPALENVIADYRNAGLIAQPKDRWLLDQHSRREVLHWHAQGQIPDPDEQTRHQVVSADGRDFLLTLIPLHDVAGELDRERPAAAAALVWKDISDALATHHQDQRVLVLRWSLAFLAAMGLLLTLLLAMRRVVEKQNRRHRKAIWAESQQREQARQLLAIITSTQSAYISAQNPQDSFARLLERILQLTDSEFGFVGEVFNNEQGEPYLKTYAISNIAWDSDSLDVYRQQAPQGMVFSKVDTLFGEVLTSQQAVISNNPTNDPRSGGLPPGHPALRSFAGLPILFGDTMVGMIGLANRDAGYDNALISFLAPLQRSLGQLIHALREDRARHDEQTRLERQRQALRALNDIAAVPNPGLLQRLHRVLELGCSYLQVEMGIVTEVQGTHYQVMAQHAPGQDSLEGVHFELSLTYCSLALQHGDILAIHHMAQSSFKDQRCYKQFGLETYIGIPLLVDGEVFGTLAFNSRTPRDKVFDDTDMEFMRLCARWIGSLLAESQAEQERTALLQRFNKLSRHLPGVVYQYQQNADGHSWFPFSSDGVKEIYGVTPEQALVSAEAVFNRLHPEDVEEVARSIEVSATNLSDWQATYRVIHPHRGIIWVAGHATPERLDNGDTVWHGFITDISETRARADEIKEARAFLRAVIDSATEVAIIATDAQGLITLFNPGAERLLGYTADELIGRQTPAHFHLQSELLTRHVELFPTASSRTQLMQVFLHPAGQGVVQSRVWSYVRKDGEQRQVNLSVTPINAADGSLNGLLGMATDITEQLRVETLKSEFISTVNHELRTPLTSVIGALGLLRGGALGAVPDPMRRLLDIAEQNTQQLNALINDLLDLDKLSAGQMPFDIQWLSVEEALQQAIAVNQSYAERYRVNLVLVQPVPAARIAADPRRLAQILANLLSNACKFSPSGASVSLQAEWQADKMRISVTDCGIGIAPEFHARIFRRFAQADGSSTRQHGGTGLGLAISRELVRQMGGDIDFRSTPGQGSCFWFTLPAHSAPEE